MAPVIPLLIGGAAAYGAAKVVTRGHGGALSELLGNTSPKVPAPPGVPNPNDAANAARAQTDALRMRRGMLANIYAGSLNQAPTVGRTQLGGG